MGFASAVTNHSSALLLISSQETTLDRFFSDKACVMDATAACQLLIIIADLAVPELVLLIAVICKRAL